MGQRSERQVYLVAGERQSHAFVLEPEADTACREAVVMCYPLFYERTFAGRCYMYTARALQARGLRVVLFDYEEYGSSRKARAEPSLDGHVEQVATAIALAQSLGSERIGLFGTRFGGLLAYLAASRRGDLASLALWSPLHRPNAFARELRMKERLRRLQLKKGGEEPEVSKDEPLDVNGYLASARLMADVEQLKLERLEPPSCPIMVAGFQVGDRPAPEPDAYVKLLQKAASRPVTDTTDEARPWMFTERADPVIPPKLVERTCAFLAETLKTEAGASPSSKPASVTFSTTERLEEGEGPSGARLGVERTVSTRHDGRLLHGVVHEPPSTVARLRRGFLFFDTTNKLMVELARELSARGFPVLRADNGSCALSFGETLRQPPMDVLWSEAGALADFAAKELGVDHVGVGGLCFLAMLSARLGGTRPGLVDRLVLVGMPFHAEGLEHAVQDDPGPPPQPSTIERIRHEAMARLADLRERAGEQVRLAQDSESPILRVPSRTAQQLWTARVRPLVERGRVYLEQRHKKAEVPGEVPDQIRVQESLLAYSGRSIHLLSQDDPAADPIVATIRFLETKGYQPTVAVLPGHASNSFNGIAERKMMVDEVVRWALESEGAAVV